MTFDRKKASWTMFWGGRWPQIVKDLEEGVPLKEIAPKHGVSEKGLREIIKKMREIEQESKEV